MRKYTTLILLTALSLLLCQAALAQDATDIEARKAKILENLKLKFPQLGQANVSMGALGPSGYGGLDEGSFVIATPRGEQTQRFLVSTDDKKLYLVAAEAIDVSLDAEGIAAEQAKQAEAAQKQAEEELKQASERAQELEELVAGLPMRGNPDAPVTIVEFSDFQCPYCTRGAATVEEILEKYPNDVKFVFQHFPLNFHPWAKPASIAAHCAGLQDHDAFWSLHDAYFENQKALNPGNILEKSKEYLAGSSIDMDTWGTCAENKESEEYKAAAAAVDASMAAGQKFGVSGTPGFFVNGQFLNGAQPITAFEPLIAAAKKSAAGGQ